MGSALSLVTPAAAIGRWAVACWAAAGAAVKTCRLMIATGPAAIAVAARAYLA